MNNVFLLNELHTKGYMSELLTVFSVLAVISAIFVVVSKNPIISILFLINLFSYISLYLMLIGFYFLGLSYLLVYIGAVSILFLFILMLINVRVSELLSDTNNRVFLVVILGILFTVILNSIIPYGSPESIDMNENTIYNEIKYIMDLNLNKEFSDIHYVSSPSWDTNLTDNSYIISVGNVLYTNYSIWLIITSIILLLAMVGCIIITIRQK